MSKCTLRNKEFLKDVYSCTPLVRNQVIQSASADNLNCLNEIAANTLKGNIPVNSNVHSKLKKNRTIIRKFKSKTLSVKKKRELFMKYSKYLPLLLQPFLSATGAIAGKIIANSYIW